MLGVHPDDELVLRPGHLADDAQEARVRVAQPGADRLGDERVLREAVPLGETTAVEHDLPILKSQIEEILKS